MFYRPQTNIRWKNIFRGRDEREDEYIPKLHINSDLVPDLASEEIERDIDEFEKRVWMQQAKYVCPKINILKPYSYAMRIGKIHAQEQCLQNHVRWQELWISNNWDGVSDGKGSCWTFLSKHNVYQIISENNARAQPRNVELLVGFSASRWQNTSNQDRVHLSQERIEEKQKQISKVLHHY